MTSINTKELDMPESKYITFKLDESGTCDKLIGTTNDGFRCFAYVSKDSICDAKRYIVNKYQDEFLDKLHSKVKEKNPRINNGYDDFKERML